MITDFRPIPIIKSYNTVISNGLYGLKTKIDTNVSNWIVISIYKVKWNQ